MKVEFGREDELIVACRRIYVVHEFATSLNFSAHLQLFITGFVAFVFLLMWILITLI